MNMNRTGFVPGFQLQVFKSTLQRNNLKRILGGAAVLLAISSAAIAQTAQAPGDPLLTRPGFQAGAQIAHYHYEEPGIAKLIGPRAGGVGSYTLARAGLLFKAEVRGSYGRLKYQGSGTQDRVPDSIFETRLLVGKDFLVGDGIALSPYAGLGYRALYNDLRGYSQIGAQTYAGYRRYSKYVYAPVGLTARIGLRDRWVLAPTVEYDLFIRGRQDTKLSDVGGCNQDVTNKQTSGYGYRTAFMVENSRWAFGPWLHHWSIDASDIQPIGCGSFGREPKNWTREAGIEVRYRF
jgi:hypothetical protein